jgi:8-oxo-dGTP pyrophosphatase MutT (NUDIX family)
VRYEDAIARLAVLPAPLPSAPASLTPVRTNPDVPLSFEPNPATVKQAAVLVLVTPDEAGHACVVLTERVNRGGHHSGEVSLPGGRAEPGDADLAATALREAAEEVALDPLAADVRVVGPLDSFWIPVSDFQVTPILAVATRRPRLEAAPHEVARIIEAPVAAFLPGVPLEIVERTIRGWDLRYTAYRVGDVRVWGATARILGQLGAILDGDPA